MPHTLVTFHAHPDDEALLTAGTMAKAAADGHRVVLVFATRGGVGAVASDFLARDEDLADRRTREALASAEVLGVARTVFLDYGDSGNQGQRLGVPLADGAAPPFAGVSVDDAAARLADVLREEQAEVLTVYDPNGGYGHPDHLQVRAVGVRAAELAGTAVVLEATINRELMRLGVDLAASLGYALPPEFSPETFDRWFTPQEALTHAVDVSGFLAQKRASMEAHASQATGDGESPRSIAAFLAIPEEYFAMAFGTEWYVELGRPPGIAADDVFASLAS